MKSKLAVLTLVVLLGACGATAPTPDATGALDSGNPDLACLLASARGSYRPPRHSQPIVRFCDRTLELLVCDTPVGSGCQLAT